MKSSVRLSTITALMATMMPLLAGAQSAGRFAWVLEYAGQSENAVMRDERTERMIQQRVPTVLSRDLLMGLWGPPDPVFVVTDRFVSMSACRQGSCGWKSFFWIDTTTGVGLGAVWGSRYPDQQTLRLASNGMQAERIPSAAQEAIVVWLSEFELRPAKVVFAGSTGEWQEIEARTFQPRDRYRPAPGGPSFDCEGAAGAVQLAICHSPHLSKSDLELFQLADRIRRGHSTLAAREELAALQSDWIRERDAECVAAADLEACLDSRYQAQYEALRHWVPRRPVTSSSSGR